MKSLLSLVASLSIAASTSLLASDFSIAKWGDSKGSVIVKEEKSNITPFDEDDYLIYKFDIMGMKDVRLVYQFRENKLNLGVFIFKETHETADHHINDFQDVNLIVSKKYGDPMRTGPVWIQDVVPMDAPDLADALIKDKVYFQSVWQTPRTIIEHQLTMRNGEIIHQLVYKPTNDVLGSLFQESSQMF